jgi:hypothetical protein
MSWRLILLLTGRIDYLEDALRTILLSDEVDPKAVADKALGMEFWHAHRELAEEFLAEPIPSLDFTPGLRRVK